MQKLSILGLIKKHWPKAIVLVVLILVSSFLSTYPINLLRRVIDIADAFVTNGASDKDLIIKEIIFTAALYLTIQIINSVVTNISNYYTNSLQANMAHSIRMDVYKHLSKLHQNFFDNNDSSETLNKVIQDSDVVVRGFVAPISYLSKALFSFAFGFYFMWSINPTLTLIILPLAIACGILARLTGGKFRMFARENRKRNGVMWSKFQEGIKGVREVHAFNQESEMEDKIAGKSKDVINNIKQNARYAAIVNVVNNAAWVLIISVMLSAGAIMIINGNITIGGVTAILMYNEMLSAPVYNFISMFVELIKVDVSIKRLNTIFGTEPDKSYNYLAKELDINEKDLLVEFDNVKFHYFEDRQIFENLSFEMEQNKQYAIVGSTGSGKSTIVKLIDGLYPYQDGNIKIFGYSLNEENKLSLRKHIGFIFQDTFLFNATVRENIIFANPNVSEERLQKALEISCSNEIIAKLDNGLDTMIGENGVKLSGGERQRIGIARALIRDVKLLVLDEATSALDNTTEKKVMDGILSNYPDTSMIIVAHRLSTIENVDTILVMENGKIVESGNHQELLNKNGVYKALHDAKTI